MADWDHWRTVLAVFRHGTYNRAAQALRLDATTVGRRLKALERSLGFELFQRENDRLQPTRRCEELLSHVEAADDAIRRAEQQSANDGQPGAVWRELRLTAPPFVASHLLAPHVADLTAHHRITLELMGTPDRQMFSRREADMALRLDDGGGGIAVDAGRMAARQIGVIDYAVYAGAGAEADHLAWAGLFEGQHHSTGSRAMARLMGEGNIQFRAYHFETLREIAAAGVARAMLPCFMGRADQRLRQIGDAVLRQPLWLLYHRQDADVQYMASARAWIEGIASRELQR